MNFYGFHPIVREWFFSRFEEPTEPQQQGWPEIASGQDTLIAAPTGSGKTLTAFLAVIDRLLKEAVAGKLEDGMRVVYVSPLRALSNDMHRNLSGPLTELSDLAAERFPEVPVASLRAGLRTGDTTSSQRAALVRKPPHVLVTTPESLFLLLTAERGREALKTVDTVIVDEIHALVRDKRGSHLALSLERLEALCGRRLQRIGLSATQKPIARMAEFLVGDQQGERDSESHERSPFGGSKCSIVDIGHSRELDLRIEAPPSELSAVCSVEQWDEVNQRIVELIQSHRSTLIFVNTRRLAERVTHQLSEILGEDQVGSHHGSLASDRRLQTEQRLKNGELKAVVATASLELGLDVGYIDLVIQIGSPRAIATFLQRIGRSGHSLGKTPRGRLFALTRDELVECMGLIRAVRAGRLDVVPIPEAPIDVLAQQIVAEVACREWNTDELFARFRRAWPYRELSRERFDETIQFLSEGLTDRSGRGKVYLHHDQVGRRVRTRPGARIVAASNAGAIPEIALFRVVTEDGTVVGTLDEDFAIESHAGQIFLLGNTSWRIQHVRGTDVTVSDAQGAPPTIPFWRGEAPGRTIELSQEVSRLRSELEEQLKDQAGPQQPEVEDGESAQSSNPSREQIPNAKTVLNWLIEETACSEFAAAQVVNYVSAQIAAVGVVPTQQRVIFERFFDETGGMQMVVHAPFGLRITHAWGLAMRKRFCRSFDFELQATADDDGFILSLGPQHSFPLESMFPMLNPENVRSCVEQAILYIPMFQIRWRWNANRALLVPRRDKGKKVPPNLQRFRADDLLTSVFPLLTGCQENVVGELELPDQILVQQTMYDCLTEALDIESLEEVLGHVQRGEIEFVARDTREPSPFSYELLNSNPYAFLDGGEIAERRARAVSTRRSISIESVDDLGRLDPLSIERVIDEARPLIRNADELHDVLLGRIVVLLEEIDEYGPLLEVLAESGRAARLNDESGFEAVVAAERLPAASVMFPEASLIPEIEPPPGVRTDWTTIDARVATIRGLMETSGPVTHEQAAIKTGMLANQAFAALEALEGEGVVLRGRFTPRKTRTWDDASENAGHNRVDDESSARAESVPEWCHRRLLARIHRLTMDGLRQQIEPVSPEVFLQFLLQHHGLTRDTRRAGPNGVFEVISMLQGLDIPAVAWEEQILPARVDGFRPSMLDELCLSGEIAWGRLFPTQKERTSPAVLSRVAPVSLFLREDANWLVDATRVPSADVTMNNEARLVLDRLASQGALFAADLQNDCRLNASEVSAALRELTALGLVTADGLGGLRQLATQRSDSSPSLRRRRSGLARQRSVSGGVGRWSLSMIGQSFADSVSTEVVTDVENDSTASDDAIEQWAWQLLRRWGVVFRDLLAKESGAPRWWNLLQVYRRLEARGEIRGGRFVTGVAGEQFALGDTVRRLRALRDQSLSARQPVARTTELRHRFLDAVSGSDSTNAKPDEQHGQTLDDCLILSAVDPLNLVGIVTDQPRVAAVPRNQVVWVQGRAVAAIQNGELTEFEKLSDDIRFRLASSHGTSRGGLPAEGTTDGSNEDPVTTATKRRSIRPVIS